MGSTSSLVAGLSRDDGWQEEGIALCHDDVKRLYSRMSQIGSNHASLARHMFFSVPFSCEVVCIKRSCDLIYESLSFRVVCVGTEVRSRLRARPVLAHYFF